MNELIQVTPWRNRGLNLNVIKDIDKPTNSVNKITLMHGGFISKGILHQLRFHKVDWAQIISIPYGVRKINGELWVVIVFKGKYFVVNTHITDLIDKMIYDNESSSLYIDTKDAYGNILSEGIEIKVVNTGVIVRTGYELEAQINNAL